jgi:hypothetical protein
VRRIKLIRCGELYGVRTLSFKKRRKALQGNFLGNREPEMTLQFGAKPDVDIGKFKVRGLWKPGPTKVGVKEPRALEQMYYNVRKYNRYRYKIFTTGKASYGTMNETRANNLSIKIQQPAIARGRNPWVVESITTGSLFQLSVPYKTPRRIPSTSPTQK